jgi:hypothetical protein
MSALVVSGNLILVASYSAFVTALKIHVAILWVDTVELSELTQTVSNLGRRTAIFAVLRPKLAFAEL